MTLGARWAMGSVCVWKPWNIEHRVHSHTDTHDVSSASAPLGPAPTRAPPEDNDQARKTAEHGEQRDGVDVVNPGDPTRGGGAANRLNTRRNSQSKCGARRHARVSSRGAQRTAQSTGAAGLGVLRTASAARRGRCTYRTVSPRYLRGCGCHHPHPQPSCRPLQGGRGRGGVRPHGANGAAPPVR